MSYFLDQATNKKIEIFSGNGAKKIATEYNIPLLATLAITPLLSKYCDEGKDLSQFITPLKNTTFE